MLYDDNALYVGVRAFDDRPREIVERLTRRDRDTDADKITVDVSSKNDRFSAYHFDLNVAGVLVDGVRFNDTDYAPDWDGLWFGATSRDEHGWTAELAIPLRTLRYDGKSAEFGFQVRRYLQRRQEVDEWAYVPRTARGEVSRYGTLTGLEGLHARRLVQIAPYFAGKLIVRYDQPPLDGVQPAWSMGADLKVGLTSALTLDATLNPDFGQVEADQVVLNLTTFEVFYPEKRPFFLEGAEIFATPLQQFYSRRIGRAPPPPTLGAAQQLTEALPDGKIWIAAKLSGLVGKRLTVALLDAVTARADAAILDGAHPTRRLIEPLTNFAIARLKRDFGAASSIGVTGTAVTRFEPPNGAAPAAGDFCPDGNLPQPADHRCTHDGYTGGVDVNLKTADGAWGAFAHVVGSVVENGPVRLIPDGTLIGPGSTGIGISGEAGKYGGEHWLFHLEYYAASAKLELNDAGYLRQANLQHIHPFLIWRTKKPLGPVLELEAHTEIAYERSWDGADLRRHWEVNAFARFKNFWQIYTELDYDLSHVDNRETRDGTWTERTGGVGWFVWIKTDPRRRVNVQFQGGLWRRQRGWSTFGQATLSLRPVPAFELDVIPTGNWVFGDPRWFATIANADGGNTYFFGEQDARSFDVTLRGTYTFTPRLTLQLYTQVFLAAGHYGQILAASTTRAPTSHPLLTLDSFAGAPMPAVVSPDFREGAINVNLVLRWEYRPGATLIGVYTHASQQVPFDPVEGAGRLNLNKFKSGPATDVFLIKINALWG